MATEKHMVWHPGSQDNANAMQPWRDLDPGLTGDRGMVYYPSLPPDAVPGSHEDPSCQSDRRSTGLDSYESGWYTNPYR